MEIHWSKDVGTLAVLRWICAVSNIRASLTLTSSISTAELNIVLTVTVLFLAVRSVKMSFHVWNADCLTSSSQLFDLVDALWIVYRRGVRHSVRSHSRCVIQSVASFPCHTALVCAPVRELSLYPGTRQPVLRAGFALCPSHVPLTSGLWGSQLLKQCKAHYSHRSLQSAMVSQPSLGRYRPLLLALPLPPARWTQEDLWGRWMRWIISTYY